jgi:hypothetical protein
LWIDLVFVPGTTFQFRSAVAQIDQSKLSPFAAKVSIEVWGVYMSVGAKFMHGCRLGLNIKRQSVWGFPCSDRLNKWTR